MHFRTVSKDGRAFEFHITTRFLLALTPILLLVIKLAYPFIKIFLAQIM